MGNSFVEPFARNLQRPYGGLYGWWVKKTVFESKRNIVVSINAAQLCKIEPHHKVLEVGFGPGHGLKKAAQYVTANQGKISGVDWSMSMVKDASRFLRNEIRDDRVEVLFGDIMFLPFPENHFDRIYHTNCYYFWPNMFATATELHRVLKPHSYMVTTLNLDSLKKRKRAGEMKYGNIDPIHYMHALETAGFENVHIDYLNSSGIDFQAIYAHIGDKTDGLSQ